jgi:type IV pilus assembly protein PilC
MIYSYEASNSRGGTSQGQIEAASRTEAAELLQKKGLIPIVIEPHEEGKGLSRLHGAIFQTVTPLDRIVLVRNLAATIKAGLSIIEALDILLEDSTKQIMRSILSQVRLGVQNGQPLWQSFANHKKAFPTFFIGMLKAAETSGQLDVTLTELNQYMTREYELVRKVKGALAYPFILLSASTGVVVLLLTFVLPRLERTFAQGGFELPLITRIVLQISRAFRYSITLDAFVVGLIFLFVMLLRRTSTGKRITATIMFRIPLINNLIKKIALVRITRTLGSLIASGGAIAEALKLSAESSGNENYRVAILDCKEQIIKGIPLSKALLHYPDLFPRFLTSLVVVGEKTGTLESILKTFADFYDEEVDHTLKTLTSLLEPILLLAMGVLIGGIALSILLPVYQFVGKFV